MIVGITGGIGSGKSTVSQVFESIGIPIYNSDLRGREVTKSNPQVVEQVKALFGDEIYEDGHLKREEVAKQVFNDQSLLQKLNAIVHPAVKEDFVNWIEAQDSPYVIKESAILVEANLLDQLDHLIVVTAPKEERVARVMARDGVDEKAVLERMSKQLPDEEKAKRASYVLKNDGQELVIPQVLALHDFFMKQV